MHESTEVFVVQEVDRPLAKVFHTRGLSLEESKDFFADLLLPGGKKGGMEGGITKGPYRGPEGKRRVSAWWEIFQRRDCNRYIYGPGMQVHVSGACHHYSGLTSDAI